MYHPHRRSGLAASALTPREAEILALIGSGKTTKEIATCLSVSPETISSHRKQLCRKLRLHTTAALVAFGASIHLSPQNYPAKGIADLAPDES